MNERNSALLAQVEPSVASCGVSFVETIPSGLGPFNPFENVSQQLGRRFIVAKLGSTVLEGVKVHLIDRNVRQLI